MSHPKPTGPPEQAAGNTFKGLRLALAGVRLHPTGLELAPEEADEWSVDLGRIPIHQAAKLARILRAARG